MLLSKDYTLKWKIIFADHYQFSTCKKLINTKTRRIIQKTVNGGSIGYCIKGRFYSLTYLKDYVEKIPKKEYCPF